MGGIELHEVSDATVLTMFGQGGDQRSQELQAPPTLVEPSVQSWLMEAFAQERAPQPARVPAARGGVAQRWSMPGTRAHYVHLLTVMLLTWWLA